MNHSHFVFDAYGTLFDVHSAAARHRDAIGSGWERLSQIWRTKQLEYTWVYSLAGRPATFRAVTEQALDYALAVVGVGSVELRARLLDAYRTLRAYPEVAGVLAELKRRGASASILSNGDPDMLEEAVVSAGLGGAFDAVISVREAGIFKPSMAVYERVITRFGVTPTSVSFQSSNRWDIAGAKAFGFRTVWINRAEMPDEYPSLAPDLVTGDLTALLS